MKRTKFMRKNEERTGFKRKTERRHFQSKVDPRITAALLSHVDNNVEARSNAATATYAALYRIGGARPDSVLDEPLLDDEHPVYAGYLYVADDKVVESMITGTVAKLRRDLETHGRSAGAIRRCDMVSRGLI